jgi:uncharacterized protein YwgA
MTGVGVKKINRIVSIFQKLTGIDFNVNKYENRLMLQKIAYIVKMHDKSLNYEFSWFIRGPYSRQLTGDEYNYKKEEIRGPTERDEENIKFLKGLVGEIDEFNLELVASVYYLMTQRKIVNFDSLYYTLHSLKPWFEKNDIFKAFEKIRSFEGQ